MMRRLFLAVTLSMGVVQPSFADSMGTGGTFQPYGPTYSASSRPFEAFDWTPLDFAAFSAYGGDFANVRKPVEKINFVEDPFQLPGLPGPEDEQDALKAFGASVVIAPPQFFFFEELPSAGPQAFYDELPSAGPSAVPPIPEPTTAMLVGFGLLGMASRLRRSSGARQ